MMKRLLLALVLLIPGKAWALCAGQATTPIFPFSFETLTVSNTALPITAAKLSTGDGIPPLAAYMTVETDSIRFRVDGLAPTATVGQLVTSGQTLEICGQNALNKFRMIRVTTYSTVQYTVYKGTP